MATKKVFKVSFKGVILPGYDKEQVIENVHEITRIPKKTITRKFFSGKTVVIRHADSKEYASRLQKTFAQAGIETYINESIETISGDNVIDTEPVSFKHENLLVEETLPGKKQKSHTTTIIAGIASIIIFSLLTLFFINDDNQTQINKNKSQQARNSNKDINTSSPADNIISKPIIDSESTNQHKISPFKKDKKPLRVVNIKADNLLSVDEPLTDFLNKKEMRSVIKITKKTALDQLLQFSALLNINKNIVSIIKKNLNLSFNISDENPLYLFKTSNQTENQFSIIVNTNNKLPASIVSKLNKELNEEYTKIQINKSSDNSNCSQKTIINLLSTNNHLLITTISIKKLEEISNLLKQAQFSSKLLKLDSLFEQSIDNENINFRFYYQDKETLKSFTLSSNDDNFWLSINKNKKTLHLLQQLNIHTHSPNKRPTDKTNNLYNKSLILIAHQSDPFKKSNPLNITSLKNTFQPEQIVKILKTYSIKQIPDYNNKLDIELSPQWQSGPFSITTNQFQFNKNLSIELLAKGQNINNLMEYSHSSFLHVNSVLNKSNKNILMQDCTANKGYFIDVDGEQEAYINDEFISYQTITATKAVTIEPGYNNNDIVKVEGNIELKLPVKIQNKIIEIPKTDLYTQILDFSLLLKHDAKSNILEFKVIGNTEQFINIRAYNYAGDVIETLAFEQKAFFDNKIKIIRQAFSQPVEVIKAFYTKENRIINYPFSFKPEILPGETLTEDPEENSLTAADSQLIPYNSENLDFLPLEKKILNDNPEWLGKKWSSEKTTQKVTSPFYINLFMHESDGNKVDSVLNIKSSLSAFISQNITAFKLTLLDDKEILLDNFIPFSIHEFIEGEPEVAKDGKITPPQMTLYLDSSSAFEINNKLPQESKNSQLHGQITLSLPTSFKTQSKKYTALGQIIKLDGLFIKTVQLNKHQIQFEILGNIQNLVQLKLYNKNNLLISNLFEFSHIESSKAHITLLYKDKIDTIKLVLSQNSTIKEYPFSFSK